jgi:hypothetical protein
VAQVLGVSYTIYRLSIQFIMYQCIQLSKYKNQTISMPSNSLTNSVAALSNGVSPFGDGITAFVPPG